MHKVLSLVIEAKKRRIEVLKKNIEALRSLAKKPSGTALSFKAALSRDKKISMIAELKQASPSSGVLRKVFNPVEIAKIYQDLKVNALSVLTEEEFFLGKLQYIEDIKKKVSLPILRKDFILDEAQVFETKAAGADAILLIMGILNDSKFETLYNLSKELGLDVVVEVHTEKELKKVLKFGVDIVGINNRNLHTFKVDIKKTEKLIPFIPSNVLKISESGISSTKDILWLKGLGVNAVLIGTAIMLSDDIALTVNQMHIDK
ncbi:MAG: indole-3-glycerol phosphate synthase TrpC [Candidatus Omnitrophica bacterium]|nr:indole-3-glycerol phosphate synthase TrpC [Candidatus Omnitrophota bacterium]